MDILTEILNLLGATADDVATVLGAVTAVAPPVEAALRDVCRALHASRAAGGTGARGCQCSQCRDVGTSTT